MQLLTHAPAQYIKIRTWMNKYIQRETMECTYISMPQSQID